MPIQRRPVSKRQQQMKRELIGLVLGAVCLVTGVGILFNHTVEGNITAAKEAAVSPSATNTAIPSPALSRLKVPSVPPTVEPTVATTEMVGKPGSEHSAATLTPAAPETSAMHPAETSVNTKTNELAVLPKQTTSSETETTLPNSTKAAQTLVVTSVAETEKPADVNVTQEVNAASDNANQNSGWIYAGQFVGGKWVEQTLKIGAQLPAAGQSYTVQWDSVVRQAPPSIGAKGGKNSKVLATIAAGQPIEVLEVKPASTKGHIWLKVKQ